MKKYNFNAGPSMLPREVIENTAKQILDFNGSGLSLMEISHRAKDFQPVVDEAEALIKDLLSVPEGYSVIFLGGGASLQFTVERSGKSLIGSAASGEGLVNVYRGTGRVLMSPVA